MKKLIITSVILLGTLTITNAQSSETTAASKDASTTLQAVVQDDFKEVKVSELPQAVQESVAKDFKGATVSKAYKNAKGEFKLVVSTSDGAKRTLLANSKGEWIKKQ